MDDSRSVVLCVDPVYWLYHGFTKITFHISVVHALIHRVGQAASFYMYVLSYFQEDDSHTSILADGNPVFPRNF